MDSGEETYLSDGKDRELRLKAMGLLYYVRLNRKNMVPLNIIANSWCGNQIVRKLDLIPSLERQARAKARKCHSFPNALD